MAGRVASKKSHIGRCPTKKAFSILFLPSLPSSPHSFRPFLRRLHKKTLHFPLFCIPGEKRSARKKRKKILTAKSHKKKIPGVENYCLPDRVGKGSVDLWKNFLNFPPPKKAKRPNQNKREIGRKKKEKENALKITEFCETPKASMASTATSAASAASSSFRRGGSKVFYGSDSSRPPEEEQEDELEARSERETIFSPIVRLTN